MWYSKCNAFVRGFCILFTLAMLLPLLSLFCLAMDIPKPTDRFYVNDFANLLDADTKDYIEDVNVQLYESTGAQVVVVTLPSLNGASLEEYATALFRQYGIGSREKNNGVLLLLALEEREFRIEVGYGLEGALNDAKTGRIQDNYIIPYLKDNKWDDGIRNGFDAVIQEIKAEYGADFFSSSPQMPPEPAWYEDPDYFSILMMGTAALVGALTGKFLAKSLLPNLAWLVFCGRIINQHCGVGYAIMGVFGCAIAALIGWAITSPDTGSSSGSSYSSGRSYSSGSSYSSRSSYSSGSSYHSGGGGRSGGGGSSRKF